MKNRKEYSQEFKDRAIARLMTGEVLTHVAKDMGIPKTTLLTWRDKAAIDPVIEQVRLKNTEARIERISNIVDTGMDIIYRELKRIQESDTALTPADVQKISTTVATMIDKGRLESGEPTENVKVAFEDLPI